MEIFYNIILLDILFLKFLFKKKTEKVIIWVKVIRREIVLRILEIRFVLCCCSSIKFEVGGL